MRRQLEALYARVPLGMRLGLDAMRGACARLGHPEGAFASVHVAGTNGKGSVCAMVESIARAAGMKTGMYTSPHLVRFAERIRIDGEPIRDELLAPLLDRALEADVSFFETATLTAFLAFREQKVDLAIVEVGIGGRLDATNVLPADAVRVSAVTKIAFDHMDKLGDTLEKIALEKAAIARPGVPLVHGELPPEALAAVERAGQGAGARLVASLPYDGDIGLVGPHQRYNAGLAASIGRELGVAAPVVARGIASAAWPGRFERIGDVILDGAHNPDGMQALVAALAREPRGVGAVVFGALADKSWRTMLAELGRIDAPRFYVAPAGRAPADLEELARLLPGTPMRSLTEGLDAARAVAAGRPVVVCGSLYLVGEARAELLGLPRDPAVAL